MRAAGLGPVSDINWLVSVDDHLVEPPTLWTDRVARRDRERVPHVVMRDGHEEWVYEDVLQGLCLNGATAHGGRPIEQFSYEPMSYAELRPGCYDPRVWIRDMDADGVWASLCFPTVTRFCGQIFHVAKDREMALRCLQIWNDWVIDEWCGAAPGRFIPLSLIPLWDPDLAATEIERTAAKGSKAISFSELPFKLGLPSIHDDCRYWEPVFAAANDTKMPLCLHFGSSSQLPGTSEDAPHTVRAALVTSSLTQALVDWLFSGVFERYADLKVTLAEGGIGWIPYTLERADHTLDTYRHLVDAQNPVDLITGEKLRLPAHSASLCRPTENFRRHVFGCFVDDKFGARHIDEIGVDNVMIEVDYPHKDSTFPNSLENARDMLAGYSEEVRHKVTFANALRVFDFEPAPLPA